MPGIWSSIRADIVRLEAKHAPKHEWNEATSESSKITSIQSLLETVPPDIAENDGSAIADLFSKSSEVVHYGFEGDYHAVVFFDVSKRPIKVLKW